jgi:alkylation response protein AidB-like acyl-CoA dehydrogenase
VRRTPFAELERAQGLAPAIRAAQSEIEEHRELPPTLVAELASQGMFRLLLSQPLGGHGLSLPKFIRVIETIAEADGSTGWCVAQGGVFANVAEKLHPEAAQDIWGANPEAVVATGIPSPARAKAHDNGWTLSGHWRFASGCMHANWLATMAGVEDANGQSMPPRWFLVPRDQVQIGDGWNVRGMRGTGSRSYTIEDTEVPATRSLLMSDFNTYCDGSTGLHCGLLFACGFGAVGIGIARRAIDSFVEVARGKTPVFANKKLLEDELVQTGLAQAEARWGATRAFLLEVAEQCEDAYDASGPPEPELRIRMRLAATHAMRQSAEVVDQIYALAGTDSIFDDHPIQRCFQDIHALTQQIQGRASHYRSVGRVLLGLEPDVQIL